MGDTRFEDPYDRVAKARDRPAAVRGLRHPELIKALAATAGRRDSYLANVLATEAINRYRRLSAVTVAALAGAILVISLRTGLAFLFATDSHNSPDYVQLAASLLALLLGVAVGSAVYVAMRRRRALERA